MTWRRLAAASSSEAENPAPREGLRRERTSPHRVKDGILRTLNRAKISSMSVHTVKAAIALAVLCAALPAVQAAQCSGLQVMPKQGDF